MLGMTPYRPNSKNCNQNGFVPSQNIYKKKMSTKWSPPEGSRPKKNPILSKTPQGGILLSLGLSRLPSGPEAGPGRYGGGSAGVSRCADISRSLVACCSTFYDFLQGDCFFYVKEDPYPRINRHITTLAETMTSKDIGIRNVLDMH